MNKTLASLGVIGLAAVILGLILLGPFFVIWAWNTLFGAVYAVDYTFWTWLAVLILGVFIRSDVKVSRKS